MKPPPGGTTTCSFANAVPFHFIVTIDPPYTKMSRWPKSSTPGEHSADGRTNTIELPSHDQSGYSAGPDVAIGAVTAPVAAS